MNSATVGEYMGKETAGWYVVTDLIWFGLVCWGKNHCPHVQFPPNADNQPTHDRHLVLLVFEWSYEFNVFHLKKNKTCPIFYILAFNGVVALQEISSRNHQMTAIAGIPSRRGSMDGRTALNLPQLCVYGLFPQPCVSRNYTPHKHQAHNQRPSRRSKHWRLSYRNYELRLR